MNKITILYNEDQDSDSGLWVAQCLEYDIAMQAKTLPELFIEIGRVLAGHVVVAEEEGLEPFQAMPSAPDRFFKIAIAKESERG